MLFYGGNLKDTYMSQALKRYNCHVQNVYPKSYRKKYLLQDFVFSFLYGLWAFKVKWAQLFFSFPANVLAYEYP